jgi:hypothetical protein
VRSHHEWYDGRGYPDGLAGESIPLLARILAVADSYDALLSPRPYRPALSPEAGDAVLAGGAGKQWDPLVVDRFLACRPTIEPIWQRNADSRVLPDMKCAFAGWDQDTGLELATFTGGQTRGTEDKGQGTEKPDSSLSSVLCPLSSGDAVEFWRSDGPP